MNGFNKVILAGNLTRDPELRYTTSGAAIASFDLAINRKWKDTNGEMKEDVVFVPITAFGKQGETIGQFLKKGRPLLLEGRLRTEVWDDKTTGQKRSKLSVVLESFTFLDSGTREGGEQRTSAPAKPAPRTSAPPPAAEEDDGSDVPF